MKLNKRTKSSLIQGFSFNLILLIIMVSIIMLKFIPSFQQIEWYKAELSIAHTNLEIIKKEWWSFQNFRNFILESDADDFLKTIVRSSTEVFYNRNFRNKTEENFEEFITQKISVIEDEKKSYLTKARYFGFLVLHGKCLICWYAIRWCGGVYW